MRRVLLCFCLPSGFVAGFVSVLNINLKVSRFSC